MTSPEPTAESSGRIIRSDAHATDVRRDHHRLHRGIYTPLASELSTTDRIRAAAMRAGDGAVVAGLSAAILHGTTFVDEDHDVELIRGLDGQGRMRGSVRVIRTDQLGPGDIEMVEGIRVTSPVRTAYDLGRRRPDWMALARLDDLVRATQLSLTELWSYTRAHPRTHGVPQMRELIHHIDPAAESPGESWLRLVMIRNHLPRPDSQIVLTDTDGRMIARFDLGYKRYKLGIDYDGIEFHTSDEQRAHDARRDRAARDRGWEAIRVAGTLLSRDPCAVINTIENAMRQRGYRP
ncbi:hypothetical protein [Williamsia maris]|uniref:Transcriptional regulator, AbiEi antitoxin, Type IV TA system n=1 Tax=Williamsia maris TaxID=72806 RepID=A0ABT1H7M2_9NOCA|nr:hypothetical protein [Williamsia maris]MCP2174267.1 Transcriptional regulator, AbiEi antitoxin, Type IV TA system [Williamsia maris]